MIDPEEGRLAGGDVGAGRLAAPERIVDAAARVVARDGDLAGLRLVVTAGGTREPIDPVRFIGNRSSGKMGFAIAERRGGPRRRRHRRRRPWPRRPTRACASCCVETAEQMADATLAASDAADAVVMAAAVADFRPKAAADSQDQEGRRRPRDRPRADARHPARCSASASAPTSILVGFAAETDDVRANAASKLAAKRVDLMVGNDVRSGDSGFEVDTNRAVLLDAHGGVDEPGLVTKVALADLILDRVRDARRPHEGAST